MGCSRGGTTLTQRLVAERLDLYTLPETRFFASMVGNTEARMFPNTARPLPGLKRLTSRLREAMRRSTGMEFKDIEGLEMPAPRKWARFADVSLAFVARLDRTAAEKGRAGWLEKTPLNQLYAPEIQRYVPGAWMIHVIRDPQDTIASMWDMARQFPDTWGALHDRIERPVDYWNANIAGAARMVGQPRQIFVPYEALARAPEAIMDQIAEQLAPGAPRPAPAQAADNQLTKSYEAWKAGAVSGEVKPAASKWMTALSAGERARAEPLIRPVPAVLRDAMAPFADLAAAKG